MQTIYVPKGRAREYAALAINLFMGCSHGCVYCFVPGMPGRSVETHNQPRLKSTPEAFLRDLNKSLRRSQGYWGNASQVHMCFTTDPYTEFEDQAVALEASATRIGVIDALHHAGLGVALLTKAGKRSIVDLDRLGPADAMAVTITVLEDEDAKRWEPYAARPMERLEALKEFHARGIPTWMSLEPVIDPGQSLAAISNTHSFVDVFKVGRMNHCGSLPEGFRSEVMSIDWEKFGVEAIQRLEILGYRRIHNPDEAVNGGSDNKLYYVKKDLVKCLR